MDIDLQRGSAIASGELRLPSGSTIVQDTRVDVIRSIEQVVGSVQDDRISGTDGMGERLIGNAGRDVIDGRGDNDQLYGGDGDDRLSGGSGNDFLQGGRGDDRIDGGSGNDTVIYDNDEPAGPTGALRVVGAAGVQVDLASGRATGGFGNDTLVAIENASGSSANDQLRGTDGANGLTGGAGSDALFGRGGDDILSGGRDDDTLDGGDGRDTASYDGSGSNYTVTANADGTFTVTGRAGALRDGTDTLTNIEVLSFLAGTIDIKQAAAGLRPTKVGIEVSGTAGSDRLEGTADSDTFDGGAGIDTVVFAATRDAANVIGNDVRATVATPSDGADTLNGIERLAFTNGTLALDVDLDENAGTTFRIYQAAFNRTPDNAGLKFWLGNVDDGLSFKDLATGFTKSTEFVALYGGTDNAQYAAALYANVLGRPGDPAGSKFWEDVLNDGSADRADVLVGFTRSDENLTITASATQDGIFIV